MNDEQTDELSNTDIRTFDMEHGNWDLTILFIILNFKIR